METVIHLSNGMQFNLQGSDYNPVSFAKSLNNNQIQMIAVGNIALNKTAISYAAPKVAPENANVDIYLTDGRILKTFVSDFNADELSLVSNNQQFNVINIGEVVINKYLVMMVVPTGDMQPDISTS